jgi:Peptidase family M28/PKD domain
MKRVRSLAVVGLALTIAMPLLPSAQAAGGGNVAGITDLLYQPNPAYSQMPASPDPAEVKKPNPKGNWNAYDLNVFETIHFPTRQAADESAKDAPGGAIAHGACQPHPVGCANHSLEFIKFWRGAMNSIVKPWGGFARAYEFINAGDAEPRTGVLTARSGKAYNLQATIPGAVHPEKVVIVSGHYDQTDSGPASAWDSAEGHATVFRIAKLMTDYWRKTGTRPAVTVKFGAWAGEESGTNGAEAWIRDNLKPFPDMSMPGYFNLDPCAGGYPAYYHGNPAYQIPTVMQLANPASAIQAPAKKKIEAFNKLARVVLGEVFNHLDDKMTDVPTEPQIFVSNEEAKKLGVASHEDKFPVALGGVRLFSSDYARFEEIGVPIFNLFADTLGPHAGGATNHPIWHADSVTILHTPRDNLLTMNAFTGVDQTGMTASQGWYKGLEMCAHLHSWFMLKPSIVGSAKKTGGPVAYFEALTPGTPAPFAAGKKIVFDANGSHGYRGGKIVGPSKLKFKWNFGDGSRAKGGHVTHAFKKAGIHKVSLTVIGAGGRDTYTMRVAVG